MSDRPKLYCGEVTVRIYFWSRDLPNAQAEAAEHAREELAGPNESYDVDVEEVGADHDPIPAWADAPAYGEDPYPDTDDEVTVAAAIERLAQERDEAVATEAREAAQVKIPGVAT